MEHTQHLLLVDDHNPDDVQMMMFELDYVNTGDPDEHLWNGAHALEFLEEWASFKIRRPRKSPSVLMDMKVPKNAGREILAQLAHSKKLNDIPIFVVVSDEDDPTEDEAEWGDRVVKLNTGELHAYRDALAQLGISWVESDRPS